MTCTHNASLRCVPYISDGIDFSYILVCYVTVCVVYAITLRLHCVTMLVVQRQQAAPHHVHLY